MAVWSNMYKGKYFNETFQIHQILYGNSSTNATPNDNENVFLGHRISGER